MKKSAKHILKLTLYTLLFCSIAYLTTWALLYQKLESYKIDKQEAISDLLKEKN